MKFSSLQRHFANLTSQEELILVIQFWIDIIVMDFIVLNKVMIQTCKWSIFGGYYFHPTWIAPLHFICIMGAQEGLMSDVSPCQLWQVSSNILGVIFETSDYLSCITQWARLDYAGRQPTCVCNVDYAHIKNFPVNNVHTLSLYIPFI